MPNILNQIPEDMAGVFADRLRSYASTSYGGGTDGAEEVEDEDEDVPELVENFDEVAGV